MIEKKIYTIELEVTNKDIFVKGLNGETVAVSNDNFLKLKEISQKIYAYFDNDNQQYTTQEIYEIGTFIWKSTLGNLTSLSLSQGIETILEIHNSEDVISDLEFIAWECMLEPQLGLPLAFHPNFTIIRNCPIPDQTPPVSNNYKLDSLPLRILIIANKHTVDKSIKLSIIEDLTRTLDPLVQNNQISIQTLYYSDSINFKDLFSVLTENNPQIIHILKDNETDLDSFCILDEDNILHNLSFFQVFEKTIFKPKIIVISGIKNNETINNQQLTKSVYENKMALITILGPNFDKSASTFWLQFYTVLAKGLNITE